VILGFLIRAQDPKPGPGNPTGSSRRQWEHPGVTPVTVKTYGVNPRDKVFFAFDGTDINGIMLLLRVIRCPVAVREGSD